MAQVDAADERDVGLGAVTMPQHDQLLVVGAERANPHVEQALPAGGLDRLDELAVLDRAEAHRHMGPPEQPADLDTPLGGPGQDRGQLGAGPVELLVRDPPASR